MSESEQPGGETMNDDHGDYGDRGKQAAQRADGDEAYFADLPLGAAWGESITKGRADELEARLQAWEQEADHGKRKGPFERMVLTGADVLWLAARTLAGSDEPAAVAREMNRLRSAKDDVPLRYSLTLSALNLSGATLFGATLSGAMLKRAIVDKQTDLTDVALTDTPHWYSALVRRIRHKRTYGSAHVADIAWNDFTTFTFVDWSGLRRLGDERGEPWWWRTRDESERAARANVQLAKRLRDAGINDDADRFAYRAQVCQRGVHLLRLRLGRWLFSWLLFIIAGYGYRPLRTLFWYLAVIGGFAFSYYMATRGAITFGLHQSKLPQLPWYEALVLSVSSFHGRGFLPFPDLGDPVTILAAIEAVFGLFIEVSFIATFTQRYFGK